jgi:hypothetical protein
MKLFSAHSHDGLLQRAADGMRAWRREGGREGEYNLGGLWGDHGQGCHWSNDHLRWEQCGMRNTTYRNTCVYSTEDYLQLVGLHS